MVDERDALIGNFAPVRWTVDIKTPRRIYTVSMPIHRAELRGVALALLEREDLELQNEREE